MIPGINNKKQSSITGQVMKASAVLLKVLQEENTALEKGGIDRKQPIVEKKVEAINAYDEAQEQFLEFSRGNKIDKDDSNIAKISEMINKIRKENDRNEHLLRINIEISEKIIAAYKDAQVKNAVNQRGYNRQGKANSSKENKEAMPAISLNNKI